MQEANSTRSFFVIRDIVERLSRDKTLGEWYARGADLLRIFQPVAKEELLRSAVISFDDTSMPMRNLEHEKNIQRGHVWIYLGDRGRTALCDFSADWKGVHPRRILEGYGGTTQHDGYSGIKKLYQGISLPRQAGCLDHSRRKFVQTLEGGDNRAAPIVLLMAKLYEVEREADNEELSESQRLLLRKEKSVPVFAKLDVTIDKLRGRGKSRTPLAKAVTYFTNQRKPLGLFLEFGSIPISNAHVERLIRLVALLRKNSLCVGSEDGGHRYAVIMTLALNCLLVGAKPLPLFPRHLHPHRQRRPRKRCPRHVAPAVDRQAEPRSAKRRLLSLTFALPRNHNTGSEIHAATCPPSGSYFECPRRAVRSDSTRDAEPAHLFR